MDRKITMEEVIDLDNIEVYATRGDEHYFKCPVCGREKYKCSYNSRKQVFHCFHCDAKGGAVELHAEITGQGYKGSLRQLLDTDIPLAFRQVVPTSKPKETKKAAEKVCSKTYKDLAGILGLSDAHRDALRKRGLTDEDIKKFSFATSPVSGTATADRLLNLGDTLEGVPGFYKNSFGSWTIAGIKRKGYLCPVFSANGDIRGFQKRLDNPVDQKYVWLSSQGRNLGVSSGGPATFLKGKRSDVVIVTEGILKATVVYALLKSEVTVIGVPGVKVIKDFIKELNNGGIKKDAVIIEAYDMDKAPLTKEVLASLSEDEATSAVKKQKQIETDEKKFVDAVTATGRKVIPLHWDRDASGNWRGNFKGLDDMLLNENAPDALLKFLSNVK